MAKLAGFTKVNNHILVTEASHRCMLDNQERKAMTAFALADPGFLEGGFKLIKRGVRFQHLT